MSGTFKIDQEFFPVDPISKRWSRQATATSGEGEKIYANFWSLELSFSTMAASDELSWFYDRWVGSSGLHTVCFPHPRDGTMTGFTGVSFDDFSYEFTDVDNNAFGEGGRAIFSHISLSATGSCSDC